MKYVNRIYTCGNGGILVYLVLNCAHNGYFTISGHVMTLQVIFWASLRD